MSETNGGWKQTIDDDTWVCCGDCRGCPHDWTCTDSMIRKIREEEEEVIINGTTDSD
jgi:hypothetical protein